MTEIGNVVFPLEKIDQLKAEIEQAAAISTSYWAWAPILMMAQSDPHNRIEKSRPEISPRLSAPTADFGTSASTGVAFAQRQLSRIVFKGASYLGSAVPSCMRCTKLVGLSALGILGTGCPCC